MEHIAALVRDRRSVRTFDGRALCAEDIEKLGDFLRKIENPYEIPVEFKLLDAKRDGLSSPVIAGTEQYVGAKVKRMPHAEEAFGYSFEMLVLCAQSLGVGTTWIGGTMDRAAFERAMALGADEVMPCVSPLGYPAAKMSLRESVMRKGVKADARFRFEELFFDGDGKALTEESAGELFGPLEMVRLAPSAVNKQPWRVLVSGNAAHFYEKKNKGFVSDAAGDLQKVDLGIALCHFALGAQESGLELRFSLDDPKLAAAAELEYIATWTVMNDNAGGPEP
ncbi:MAG: nitroreductase [Oscillospiraceae bacterium]|nr:nitroreductase [Oscillospiraceae bacterium]